MELSEAAMNKRRSTERVTSMSYMSYNQRASSMFNTMRSSIHSNSLDPNGINKGKGGPLAGMHPLVTKGRIRRYLYDFVESKSFHTVMLLIILSNTAVIGMQTVPSVQEKIGWYLSLFNIFFLGMYIIEFMVKFGAVAHKYFYDRWNLFDFFIVITSIFDIFWPMIIEDRINFDTDVFKIFRLLKSFRALRALRVIRTIQFLKNLQITVNAIIQSIPALGSIIMLISLVLYIFAIIGKGLYARVDPVRFGNLGYAAFTLFQLITLDDWYFIYTDMQQSHPEYWHILVYLTTFIVLENFIFINLFIAVIVDNLERAHANARQESLQVSSSMESIHSHEAVPAMALNDAKALDEVPPSGIVEYYYDGRRDAATKHIGLFTEQLATLEFYMEHNQNHMRNLNRLLSLAKRSNH